MNAKLTSFLLLWIVAATAWAQDFATKYMDKHEDDPRLTRISVSTRMMEEILNVDDAQKDSTGLLEVIAKLKSMQMITAGEDGADYFDAAEEMARKNSGRFEEMIAYDKADEQCRIYTRKKRKLILELVMLHRQGERFTVIDFTGDLNADTIDKLANGLLPKPDDETE